MARVILQTICNLTRHQTHIYKPANLVRVSSLIPQRSSFHNTSVRNDLMEFFEPKENWGETKINAGRPWKLDELRIKSNRDLHKLWYVLLKERNMIMTMEEEYRHQGESFPSPERLEKVEESMENILEVVAERNRAYSMLETGEPGHPQQRWCINELGLGYWRTETEHYVPKHMNNYLRSRTKLQGKWQNRYLRLWREKLIRQSRREAKFKRLKERKLKEVFPDAEIE